MMHYSCAPGIQPKNSMTMFKPNNVLVSVRHAESTMHDPDSAIANSGAAEAKLAFTLALASREHYIICRSVMRIPTTTLYFSMTKIIDV
jgi:hypothetical protein